MKKLLFILITIPLIFNSCKKEDNSPNNGSNNTFSSILGTWKLIDLTNTNIEGYIDPVLGTEVVTDTVVVTGPQGDLDQYITFRDDNTLLNHGYENDTLLFVDTMNYTKNGNEIIFDSVIVFTITQLTNTNLSYNLLNPGDQWTDEFGSTIFWRMTGVGNMSKSNIPKTITPLNKKKPVSCYNSFLNRRENR